LQSENLDGKAFVEMWVRIPGKGEFFSRELDRPITGTMSWMTGNPAQPLVNGLFKTALSLFRRPVMGKFADGDAASGRDHGFLARLHERGRRAYGFAQKQS
jgi:hypothetical protein